MSDETKHDLKLNDEQISHPLKDENQGHNEELNDSNTTQNIITQEQLKVYNTDGREIEMEKDYNVSSSKHLNLKSDLILFSSSIDDKLSSIDGVVFLVAIITGVSGGYFQNSWQSGLILTIILIFLGASISIMIEGFIVKRMFKQFINSILSQDVTFEEIKIVAVSKLHPKSKILKHLFLFQKTYNKLQQHKK